MRSIGRARGHPWMRPPKLLRSVDASQATEVASSLAAEFLFSTRALGESGPSRAKMGLNQLALGPTRPIAMARLDC